MTAKSDTESIRLGLVLGAIRAERARRDVTIAALAPALGVTVQSASDKLRGKSELRVRDVLVIARALGVPARTLLAPLFDDELAEQRRNFA